MIFDPEPYAEGIRRLNQIEKERIRLRAVEARAEAARLAEILKRQDGDIREIILFGSLAEGEPARLDFDIDLALSGGDLYAALDLVEASPFDVDLVDLQRLPPHTRDRILQRGIRL